MEAPGTPIATAVRGLDGSGDAPTPAKAAKLQARVAELEVRPVTDLLFRLPGYAKRWLNG